VGTGLCSDSEQLTLTIEPVPVANAGPDTTYCSLTAHLTGSAGTNGTWSGPAGAIFSNVTDPTSIVTVPSSGTWWFAWTVGMPGCSSTDTVRITFHGSGDLLDVDAGPDQNLNGATVSDLQGSASAGAIVLWTVIQGSGTFADSASMATGVSGLSVGTNVLVLTASFGPCASASDTVVISVDDLLVPEGFSPNGDGVNDHLVITGLGAYSGSELLVFNRWGQEVYTNKAYDNSWNGDARNGQPLPDDTYFYVLNLAGKGSYNGYFIIKR